MRHSARFWLLCLAMAALVALELLGALAEGQGIVGALDTGGWRAAGPSAACRPGQPCYRGGGPQPGMIGRQAAVARILVECNDGSMSGATGTLIEKDSRRGIIVTCWHAFRDGNRATTCIFADGSMYEAEVLGSDPLWDLAALRIAPPAAEPVAIATAFARPGEAITACGYDARGQYSCGQGRVVGYVTPTNSELHDWLESTAPVRPGYSGGPTLNAGGELVAVTWGGDAGHSTATACGRVWAFLGKLLGRPPTRGDPPGGRNVVGPAQPAPGTQLPPGVPGDNPPAPIQPDAKPQAPTILPPITDPSSPALPAPVIPADLLARLADLGKQIEAAKKDHADAEGKLGSRLSTLDSRLSALAPLGERIAKTEQAVSEPRLRALVGEIAAAAVAKSAPAAASLTPAVLAALGVSFPPALAALGIAGLARRRVKRLEGQGSGFRGQGSDARLAKIEAGLGSLLGRLPGDRVDKKEEKPAAAGESFPGVGAIPRDDSEAAEFLRLSELEGRSPLHDALVGRIAFDELDNLAESAGPEAAWAEDLKRRLEGRFNQMAPAGIAVG